MPARRGEKHHKAKLTPELVREVRQRYADGQTLEGIAGWLVGLTPPVDVSTYGTLWPVVNRRTWRDVT